MAREEFDREAHRAMDRAWTAARRAGIWAAVVGGLGSLFVGLGLVAVLGSLAGGHSWGPAEVIGFALLVLIGASFGGQIAVGVSLQARSEVARRALVRRVVWLGAVGVVPLLMGLYSIVMLLVFIAMFTGMGMGGMGGFALVMFGLYGGVGALLTLVGAWPWWVLIRHRAWLQQIAAS